MNSVANHPATEAMALEARNAVVDRAIDLAIQKTTLEEFLNEDESLSETIDNLEQLLMHLEKLPNNTVSFTTLIDLRMAFKSLGNLNRLMVGSVA